MVVFGSEAEKKYSTAVAWQAIYGATHVGQRDYELPLRSGKLDESQTRLNNRAFELIKAAVQKLCDGQENIESAYVTRDKGELTDIVKIARLPSIRGADKRFPNDFPKYLMERKLNEIIAKSFVSKSLLGDQETDYLLSKGQPTQTEDTPAKQHCAPTTTENEETHELATLQRRALSYARRAITFARGYNGFHVLRLPDTRDAALCDEAYKLLDAALQKYSAKPDGKFQQQSGKCTIERDAKNNGIFMINNLPILKEDATSDFPKFAFGVALSAVARERGIIGDSQAEPQLIG